MPPRALTTPWVISAHFGSVMPFFFLENSICSSSPPSHLPPPRETEVPEDQRKGQRAAPVWPGATNSFLPGVPCELTPTPKKPK